MKDMIRNIEIQKEIMDKAVGETGFSQYGLDIVAAGVSALIINTVNSLRLLTDETTEDESGEGFWERTRIKVKQQKIMNEINDLIQLAKSTTNGKSYLMHFGI
ncbi:hypothetical protein C8Z91_05410 [Paenibacillus elgii]|uniref:Ribosomal processing cysteine protease Prp n=1 Tax=Paenibacillus elgii TaxID=189691 RepID=A0A2T6G713_9BACL|nr:ribosomal-processing cysteine protease Prp [Paenibacillus elgii]PUA39944.1 hypothetical protein C8Z91_05410 [Paenibacillus elgii]